MARTDAEYRELMALAREMRRNVLCGDIHHPAKDRHTYYAPCPILSRWDDALERLALPARAPRVSDADDVSSVEG